LPLLFTIAFGSHDGIQKRFTDVGVVYLETFSRNDEVVFKSRQTFLQASKKQGSGGNQVGIGIRHFSCAPRPQGINRSPGCRRPHFTLIRQGPGVRIFMFWPSNWTGLFQRAAQNERIAAMIPFAAAIRSQVIAVRLSPCAEARHGVGQGMQLLGRPGNRNTSMPWSNVWTNISS